jgi:hypothetical protein
MAATGEIPFWKGKDSKIIFLFEENQLAIDVINWEVERQGVEVQEPVCGEERDRLEFVVTHFRVTIEAKQQELAAMKAFLAHQKNLDARTIPKESVVAFLIYPNNGTRASFSASGYVLDAWKMGAGGRTERNALSIPGRCRYFDEAKTAGG